jgi:ankyrin repeat protein
MVKAIATLVAVLSIGVAAASFAQEAAPAGPPGASTPAVSAPSAPSPPADAPPGSSIVPKTEPLAPRAFTMNDRYLDAARRGDLDTLRLCLEKGADPHVKDGFGRSALLSATMQGRNLEMIKFLQARGLPVDEPDNQSRAPLAYAAGNGDLEIVSYLLDQGAKVERKDWQGQTALFNAAVTGANGVVERLLAAGAAIDTRDNFGDTPLIGACDKGNDATARILYERGADPALKDQEGRTARERAREGAVFCRTLPATKAAR